MPRLLVAVLLVSSLGASPALSQSPTTPSGFTLQAVGDSLTAPVLGMAIAPSGFGAHAGDVFLACYDSNMVVCVSPAGAASVFARGTGVSPNEVGFGPGGAFGTDLYVSANQDPASPDDGIVYRVDPTGAVTRFGTQTPSGFLFGAGGIAFSSGGGFGTFLYTGTSGGSPGDCVSRIDPTGTQTTLVSTLSGPSGISNGLQCGITFGSGLAGFSTDLYFAYFKSAGLDGFADGIYQLNSSFVRTMLSPVEHPGQIAFGPGGAFGRDLYVSQTDSSGGMGRILRVDAAGVATPFVRFPAGMPFGFAFADSSTMYFAVTSPFHAQLYRLVPNGTTGVGNPGPSAVLHLHAAPNPVTESVAIEWSSARGGPAELTVCSIDGRRVRELVRSPQASGRQHVTWDARDESGRRVAPGLYFARLAMGDAVESCRLVLIR